MGVDGDAADELQPPPLQIFGDAVRQWRGGRNQALIVPPIEERFAPGSAPQIVRKGAELRHMGGSRHADGKRLVGQGEHLLRIADGLGSEVFTRMMVTSDL